MLDERGVEWRDSSDENVIHTTWSDMNCWFNEFPDGWTAWGMAKRGTPEQAIAATLGAGTCRMERIEDEKRILHGWMECSECGPAYPPAAEGIQDAVKFCPFCGRKVV